MITLSLQDLYDIATSVLSSAKQHAKLSDYPGMEDYYRRRAAEEDALREKILQAADELIQKKTIQISCKL